MKIYTDAELARRKQQTDEISRIERLPEAERWRAIRELLFNVNPEMRAVDRGHCEALKEERLQNLKRTGATKTGAQRRLVSLPAYVHTALRLCDPEFLKADISKDGVTTKRLYRKVWQVFPEYRASDVI